MMKTLDRPESFFTKFQNFFEAKFQKQKMRCF